MPTGKETYSRSLCTGSEIPSSPVRPGTHPPLTGKSLWGGEKTIKPPSFPPPPPSFPFIISTPHVQNHSTPFPEISVAVALFTVAPAMVDTSYAMAWMVQNGAIVRLQAHRRLYPQTLFDHLLLHDCPDYHCGHHLRLQRKD